MPRWESAPIVGDAPAQARPRWESAPLADAPQQTVDAVAPPIRDEIAKAPPANIDAQRAAAEQAVGYGRIAIQRPLRTMPDPTGSLPNPAMLYAQNVVPTVKEIYGTPSDYPKAAIGGLYEGGQDIINAAATAPVVAARDASRLANQLGFISAKTSGNAYANLENFRQKIADLRAIDDANAQSVVGKPAGLLPQAASGFIRGAVDAAPAQVGLAAAGVPALAGVVGNAASRFAGPVAGNAAGALVGVSEFGAQAGIPAAISNQSVEPIAEGAAAPFVQGASLAKKIGAGDVGSITADELMNAGFVAAGGLHGLRAMRVGEAPVTPPAPEPTPVPDRPFIPPSRPSRYSPPMPVEAPSSGRQSINEIMARQKAAEPVEAPRPPSADRPPMPDTHTDDGNASIYSKGTAAENEANAKAYQESLRRTLARDPSKGGIPGAKVTASRVIGSDAWSVVIEHPKQESSNVPFIRPPVEEPAPRPEAQGKEAPQQPTVPAEAGDGTGRGRQEAQVQEPPAVQGPGRRGDGDVKEEVKPNPPPAATTLPPIEEAQPEPVTANPKVGDNLRVMGVNSTLADSQTIDGMRYEIFNATKGTDRRAVVRVTDMDSGKVTSLVQHPTFDSAAKEFSKAVRIAGGTPSGTVEKPQPAPPPAAPEPAKPADAGQKQTEYRWADRKTLPGQKEAVVSMSPRQYLDFVAKFQGGIDAQLAAIDSKNTAKLAGKIRGGVPLDPPWIRIDAKTGKMIEQEGRHRVQAAADSGLDKIPVHVSYMENGRFVDPPDQPIVANDAGSNDLAKPKAEGVPPSKNPDASDTTPFRGPVDQLWSRQKASAIVEEMKNRGWVVKSIDEAKSTESIYVSADSPDGRQFASFRVSSHGPSGEKSTGGLSRGSGPQVHVAVGTNPIKAVDAAIKRAGTYDKFKDSAQQAPAVASSASTPTRDQLAADVVKVNPRKSETIVTLKSGEEFGVPGKLSREAAIDAVHEIVSGEAKEKAKKAASKPPQEPPTALHSGLNFDPSPEPPPNTPGWWEGEKWRYIKNWVEGRSLPHLRALSSKVSDAFHEHAAVSHDAIRRMVDDFEAKVLGSRYNDEAFKNKVGAVLTEDNLRGVRQQKLDLAEEARHAPERIAELQDQIDELKSEGEDADPEVLAGIKSELARQRDLRDTGPDAFEAQAAAVKTHIAGHDNSVSDPYFKSEKEYQAALKDPEVLAAVDRHKQHVEKGYMDPSYRVRKMMPDDAELASRGESLGARINLAFRDEAPTGPQTGAQAGTASNARVTKSVFDRQASGAADMYETSYRKILENTVGKTQNQASKAKAIVELIKAGGAAVTSPKAGRPASMPEKSRYIDLGQYKVKVDGQEGTRLWVKPEYYHEVYNALNMHEPISNPVLKGINYVTLQGLTDFVAHSKNQFAALVGMPSGESYMRDLARKLPGVNVVDGLADAKKAAADIIANDPKTREELAHMARNAMLRPKYDSPDAAPPSGFLGKIKPGDLLHTNDNIVRLVAYRAFDRLVARGSALDTLENRRDFVNQIGQYNPRLQGVLTRTLRDYGLAPFVTAGTAMNRLGRRAVLLDPGFKATSNLEAAKLRAVNAAGIIVGGYAAAAALNFATTGKITGRPGTPLGSVDLGGKIDDNGKHMTFDMLGLTPTGRGMGALGITGGVESARKGGGSGDIADAAMTPFINRAASPFLGPGVRAGGTFLTGVSIPGGRDVTKPVLPGQNKWPARGQAAASQVNEQLGSIVQGGVDIFHGKDRNETLKDTGKDVFAGLGSMVGFKNVGDTPIGAIHGAQMKEFATNLRSEMKKAPAGQSGKVMWTYLGQMTPEQRGRFLNSEAFRSQIKPQLGR